MSVFLKSKKKHCQDEAMRTTRCRQDSDTGTVRRDTLHNGDKYVKDSNGKEDKVQDQMGNFSKEMETRREKSNGNAN